MATPSGRITALSNGAAVLKYACIPLVLALAACNNPPPPAAAPQVIERTRVVEQPAPVVVEQPSVTVDLHAHDSHHDDDDRRRREEEARRHDEHPH